MSAPGLIIGVTGASGTVYAVRALELLKKLGVETHLVMSRSAQVTLAYETDLKVRDLEALATVTYKNEDIGAAISSGSFTMPTVFTPWSHSDFNSLPSAMR